MTAADTLLCPRCHKDPQPSNFVDPRRCAFDAQGRFHSGNWNCATMTALRLRMDETKRHYSNDQTLDVLALDGTFLVLGWYKNRGAVETAVVIDGHHQHVFTLAMAEALLDGLVEELNEALGHGDEEAPHA